jgi:hypothetical protein
VAVIRQRAHDQDVALVVKSRMFPENGRDVFGDQRQVVDVVPITDDADLNCRRPAF